MLYGEGVGGANPRICRCSETLRSIFDNAASPELLKVSIYDQIYLAEGERQCVDVFCELVGEAECRRNQIVSSQIDALNATVRWRRKISGGCPDIMG